MWMKFTAVAVGLILAARPALAGSPGPNPLALPSPIETPRDRPYQGEILLEVDASDLEHRIVHVHEKLSLQPHGVLLYPRWLPGEHAPQGPIDRIAGIKITAQGTPIAWKRDPVDVYALRVENSGSGVQSIDVDFDYLSPTSPAVGAIEMSRDLLLLEWNELVLYPAGYFVRQIPVHASVTLPAGFQLATALDKEPVSSGARTQFTPVNLETLVDSPVYAGRYAAQLELDPGGPVPVHLDLFADRPALLAVKPEQLAAHRALVQQAYKLFGSHHYAHYDFLFSLSDQIRDNGLEHAQSSEDGSDPESFSDWDKVAYARDLLPHEFTHSWNGKFRRPADLWIPNYNVPMQDSLLWVYEGQTQYWGEVLTARSSLWTRQQMLDQLALTAADYDYQTGRRWRPLQDTTNDPIINPRRPMSWRDWQRFEDYYSEGALLWLDIDTLIRQRSQNKRSLDDFAHAFFGVQDGSSRTLTYTLADVVKALNGVEAYDWAAFLHDRIDVLVPRAPLDGIRRGGYALVYTDTPNEFQKAAEGHRKRINLMYSIGVAINDSETKGHVSQVLWNGPAFKAKLTEGSQILAVNGTAYDGDLLKEAIQAAHGTQTPVELIVKNGDSFKVVTLAYHDGLRYPHLERDAAVPALLDHILTPKQ